MSDPEDVRTIIIKEAQRLFFTQAYSSVLMSDLASKLGISKKTLYRHFRSKESLLIASINSHRQQVDAEVEQVMQHDELPFPDKANQVFKVVSSRLIAISSTMLVDIKKHAPKAFKQIQNENINVSYNRFSRLVAEGQRQGFIREGMDLNIAAISYIYTVEIMFDPDFITHLPAQLRDVIPTKPSDVFEGLLSIIMKGILK